MREGYARLSADVCVRFGVVPDPEKGSRHFFTDTMTKVFTFIYGNKKCRVYATHGYEIESNTLMYRLT